MIKLKPVYLKLLQDHLKKHVADYDIRLFGSRATDSCKPFSDIDLVIMSDTPIAPLTLAKLDNALSSSSLPYKVDIVEWCDLDDSFKSIIESNFEVIQTKA